MARKQKQENLNKIYRTIKNNPGKRPGLIASLLGIPRSQVNRSLAAMDDHGYYLSEDEKGGLWPFRRR